MKRILITGANSYIGTSFQKWLCQWTDKYIVDSIDMRDDKWLKKDFSNYDVVFHVAGIAHVKETSKNKDSYYKVNRDMAFETAKKAKNDTVKQFIFLSSMSVYGMETGVIDSTTPLKPNTHYGKSKLEAEELIKTLQDDNFRIAILRPPMVYGKGCKGNYPRLARLAVTVPIFPKVENKRSMIHIYNLSELVKLIIDNRIKGVIFPQNKEYVNTSEMVKLIAEVHGKRLVLTKLFTPLLWLLNICTANKVFGDLVYDKRMSNYKCNYRVIELKESIKVTEE